MSNTTSITNVTANTLNGNPLVVIPNQHADANIKQLWPQETINIVLSEEYEQTSVPVFLNNNKLKQNGLEFKLEIVNSNDIDHDYFREQNCRAGRNENDSKIVSSMRDTIHMKDATSIVFNPPEVNNSEGGNNKTITIAGSGRGRALTEELHFDSIIGWMPNRPLTEVEQALIGLQSNDHLHHSPVSREDLLHTIKSYKLPNLIGLSEEEADLYINNPSEIDTNRYSEIQSLIKNWIKDSSGRTFSSKTRDRIFDYVVENLQGENSGTFTLNDSADIHRHLENLFSKQGYGYYSFAINNNIEPILALVNDGTRKPENIFGSAVNKYHDQQLYNEANGIGDVSVINIVTAASTVRATNWETKLGTFWKIYRMRYQLIDFLNKIKKMTGNKDIFTKSIPKINVVGIINPFRQFEEYGLPYQELIDYSDKFPPFDEIVKGLYTDGLISESVKTKRLNDYENDKQIAADYF